MAEALSIAYTATPLPAGSKMEIYATGPKSAGVNFVGRGEFKLIKVTAAAAASPADVLTEWESFFGDLQAGQKVFFRLVIVNATGFASTPLETSKVVA